MARNRRRRKKVCAFCVDKIPYVDYKEAGRLRRYLTERENPAPADQRQLRGGISVR